MFLLNWNKVSEHISALRKDRKSRIVASDSPWKTIFCELSIFTFRCYLLLQTYAWTKTMKSPTPRIRRIDTPYTKEQEIFIVQRSAFMGPQKLRREYFRHFMPGDRNAHKHAPRQAASHRVVKRFEESGGVTGRGQPDGQRISAMTHENIRRVKDFFTHSAC